MHMVWRIKYIHRSVYLFSRTIIEILTRKFRKYSAKLEYIQDVRNLLH